MSDIVENNDLLNDSGSIDINENISINNNKYIDNMIDNIISDGVKNNESSSLNNNINGTSYSDKLLIDLSDEVRKLKEKIANIEHNKIVDELQLPAEIVTHNEIIGELRSKRKSKPFRPRLTLSRDSILDTLNKTKSWAKAAKFLKVNLITLKKYAKHFQIDIDVSKFRRREDTIIQMKRILNGEFPNFKLYHLMNRLIAEGFKKPICEVCGFSERRIFDNKYPLLLDFLDGNCKNHRLENIRIVCYNCMFLSNHCYMRRGKVLFEKTFNDPARVMGYAKSGNYKVYQDEE